MGKTRTRVILDETKFPLKTVTLDDDGRVFVERLSGLRTGLEREMNKARRWTAVKYAIDRIVNMPTSNEPETIREQTSLLPINELLWLSILGETPEQRSGTFKALITECFRLDPRLLHSKVLPVTEKGMQLLRSGVKAFDKAKSCGRSLMNDLITYLAFGAERNESGDCPDMVRAIRSVMPPTLGECFIDCVEITGSTGMHAACSIDPETGVYMGTMLYGTFWCDKVRILVGLLAARSEYQARIESMTGYGKASVRDLALLLSLCQIKRPVGDFSRALERTLLTSDRYLWSGIC